MRFIVIKRQILGKLAIILLRFSKVVDHAAMACVYNWYRMIKKEVGVPSEVLEAIQNDPCISKIIKEFENGQS